MNLFEADGMLKIGNVELKFLVDFEKNGDMLLWKTAKYSGFVYTKAILGAHIYQNAVRIVTPGCTADINCDGDDTAQKVLNIIANINVKLYAGKKIGAYNLEKIGDDCVKHKDGCCGECTCGDSSDEDAFDKFTKNVIFHMKELSEALEKSSKENK